MRDYIREYSASDLIRTGVSIYRQHFLVLFLVYILPTVPAIILANLIKYIDHQNFVFIIASAFATQIVAFLVVAPITVAVSDICLGNEPSLRRSYLRPFDVVGRLAGAYLLSNLIILIGMLLLYIPGLIAAVLLMFTITVVVLERLRPLAAIRRSVRLGKGHYWRNFGIILLATLMVIVPYILILIVLIIAMGPVADGPSMAPWIEMLLMAIIVFFAPLIFITLVLLYYDMRVRKENYDAAALAQDFMG